MSFPSDGRLLMAVPWALLTSLLAVLWIAVPRRSRSLSPRCSWRFVGAVVDRPSPARLRLVANALREMTDDR